VWTGRFWRIVLISTPALVLAAVGLSQVSEDTRPRLDFPPFGRQFVAEYSLLRSSLAHIIYYHGLFGFGRSIRGSDIILAGSSRMQAGISARRITRATGARAFNLAVGCNESAVFGLEILRNNRARAKLVIAEAYNLSESKSECRLEAEEKDLFQAYATVIQVWTEFAFDWLVDPFLPRFSLRGGRLKRGRFLSGNVAVNDWTSGGMVQLWDPTGGTRYGPGVSTSRPELAATSLPELDPSHLDVSISVSEALSSEALKSKALTVVTVVPFVIPGWALTALLARLEPKEPSERRMPFVPIAANGLWTYDTIHLTYPSSLLATDRLLSALARLTLR
jgi:hypothetical protein